MRSSIEERQYVVYCIWAGEIQEATIICTWQAGRLDK